MKIHELDLTAGKNKKRVGRGISAGQGKTAGRGTKGQNSRTGGGVRLGFEGGQNPLAKRLPKKRGFKPRTQTTYQVVNLEQLARHEGATFGIAELSAAGLISSTTQPVKLLARQGEEKFSKKVTVTVQAASTAARTAVEAAGGSVHIVPMEAKKATKVESKTPAPKE